MTKVVGSKLSCSFVSQKVLDVLLCSYCSNCRVAYGDDDSMLYEFHSDSL